MGYYLYDAVEDFIVGDFEHVREGLNYLGEFFTTLADDMLQCKEAGEIDIPAL